MKITTKGRYALRLMLDLAENGNDVDNVRLRDIADRQRISHKYLEQIMIHLNRAGFVRSVRGSGGGYRLTRAPSEYTVGDVIRVMEGPFVPMECAEHEGAEDSDCQRYTLCCAKRFWFEFKRVVDSFLDGTTLADLLVEDWADTRADNVGASRRIPEAAMSDPID